MEKQTEILTEKQKKEFFIRFTDGIKGKKAMREINGIIISNDPDETCIENMSIEDALLPEIIEGWSCIVGNLKVKFVLVAGISGSRFSTDRG